MAQRSGGRKNRRSASEFRKYDLPASRDIFLSHRTSDKQFVRNLAGKIEQEDFEGRRLLTWLDEAEIRPGESIPGRINWGLEHSRFVAVVMTPAYFESASGWTDAEWHAALHPDPDNRKGRIIPILAENCPYIPALLRHLDAIDFRERRYDRAFSELLSVLRNEPLPRPVTHRGQLITSSGRVDRSTLIAELAVPEATPDVVTERLYCNLLPVQTPPRYVYSAALNPGMMRKKRDGTESTPSKNAVKEAIRKVQEDEGMEPADRFMPAFRLHEGRIYTFHDLVDDVYAPLGAVIDENDVEQFEFRDFVRDQDLRKLLVSLLNMAVSRHLVRRGLVADPDKHGRFFFPSGENGVGRSVEWKPFKNRASRTVAKPMLQGGKVSFWRHQAAYVTVQFLVNRFYIKVLPTWVVTEDGHRPSGGPTVGKRVIRWMGVERNLHVLYHIRFWTTVLRGRRPGPINVRVGEQSMEVAVVPAMIEQAYGIAGDRRDLLRVLDQEAELIAAVEEEEVESALEELAAIGPLEEEGVDDVDIGEADSEIDDDAAN